MEGQEPLGEVGLQDRVTEADVDLALAVVGLQEPETAAVVDRPTSSRGTVLSWPAMSCSASRSTDSEHSRVPLSVIAPATRPSALTTSARLVVVIAMLVTSSPCTTASV